MKKSFIFLTFMMSLTAVSCGSNNHYSENFENVTLEYNWSSDQIELFNTYLDEHILPSLPTAPDLMRYFSGSIVADYYMVNDYATIYSKYLRKDNFIVSYDTSSTTYTATKNINDSKAIQVFYNDFNEGGVNFGFQWSANIKEAVKPREQAWTENEKKLFNDHLSQEYIPFPNTTHVSMTYQNNDFLWITGDYTDTILNSYLQTLAKSSYVLSKHPQYGIDVAKKQLATNKYIELWVAIADETAAGGGVFFEILARVHQGTIQVVDNKHIAFGSYPQTEIKSSYSNYNEITKLAGELPTETDSKTWSIFDDFYADYQKQSTGFYKDVEYMNNKYRLTYYLEPRTVSAAQPRYDTEFYYQTNRNQYFVGQIYVFEFKPIIWELMDNEAGVKTLAPSFILDCTSFDMHETAYVENGETRYPCQYEYSYIRQFLNDNFYNTAFNSEEKNKIQTTLVDNSEEQCNMDFEYENFNPEYSIVDDYHDYLSKDTNDNVFLFSRKETCDLDFGYNDLQNWQNIDKDKAAKPATDYACARGILVQDINEKTLYSRAGYYWLRTPMLSNERGVGVHISSHTNGLLYRFNPTATTLGVYPGIKIK